MRNQLCFLLFGCALINVSSAAELARVCTRVEAIMAETEASSLRDWVAVYASFEKYSHCDDAAIAEGYSDAIGRLLTEDWEHFSLAAKLMSFDHKFENL